MTRKRLGFFTRLLDDATPKERYRLATESMISTAPRPIAKNPVTALPSTPTFPP